MNVAATLNEAVQLHQAGQLAEAQQIYAEILKHQPQHPDALHLLGLVEHQTGNHEAGIQSISRAVQIAPQNVMYLGNLANVQLAAGRNQHAEVTLRQGIQIDPRWTAGLNLLGALLAGRGQHDEAVDLYRKALLVQPDFLEAQHNLAEALRCQGELQEAVGCFQQALELAPNHPDVCNGLGNTLREAGNTGDAEVYLRQALQGRSEFPDAWHNLGLTLLDAARPAEAAECFARAISHDDSRVESLRLCAEAFRRSGDLSQALTAARQASEAAPQSALCQLTLGQIQFDLDDLNASRSAFEAAARLDPHLIVAQTNLAEVLRRQEQTAEAEACCRQVLELDPNCVAALTNLGAVLIDMERFDEAGPVLEQARQLAPQSPDLFRTLGRLLYETGQLSEAALQLREVVKAQPGNAGDHLMLGNILRASRRLHEARDEYRAALELRPESPAILNNLAAVLIDVGPVDEAIALARQATALDADHLEAHVTLGFALFTAERYDEAVTAFQRGIEINSEYALAWSGLGNALRSAGQPEQAMPALRRAVELNPNDRDVASQLIYTAQFQPDVTPQGLRDLYTDWDRRFVRPLRRERRPLTNAVNPDRRLRLGVISSNFRAHPGAWLTIQAFEHLDRSQFELICYFDWHKSDDFTSRVRSTADHWYEVLTLSDDELAAAVRHDAIDILIVMSGHTGGNRQLVAARRPAPIQIAWTGDPAGHSGIDYLIADGRLIPHEHDEFYIESILRLPDGYVTFEPPDCAPDVGPLPFDQNGVVTFGSFNQAAKYYPALLQTWANILQAVPDSRLLLIGKGVSQQTDRLRNVFAQAGIANDRIELQYPVPRQDLLAAYNCIDIALDPFPFSGGVTTLEALWMGVPVVTLPSDNFAGRTSLTHLANVGLDHLIASSQTDYQSIAAGLAEDVSSLRELRQLLREKVRRSPLCDGPTFAGHLATALRSAWRTWCRSSEDSQ